MARRLRHIWDNAAALIAARSCPESTGCVTWTGYGNQLGYGQIEIDGSVWLAHRLAWTLAHGPIPIGALVLHECDNPKCVRVEHLHLGTHRDNAREKIERGRAARRYAAHTRVRKLTDDQVRAIRASSDTHLAIARRFGVARSTISEIRARKRKRLVPDR
jgi:hypothetical protein